MENKERQDKNANYVWNSEVPDGYEVARPFILVNWENRVTLLAKLGIITISDKTDGEKDKR